MSKPPRPLFMGIIIAGVATALFALIAKNALEESPLVRIDKKIALEFKESGAHQALFRSIMIGFTDSGGIAAMVVLAVLGVIWEAWRGPGQRKVAAGWALIVLGGALLNTTLKASFQRDRPPKEWRDPFVSETNKSFPSGHAMGGTIGIGLLGYAFMLRDRHWRAKIYIVMVLGAWVFTIGFSRIYLRAHWFSDVLGGLVIGLAWLSFGLGILETWRRHK